MGPVTTRPSAISQIGDRHADRRCRRDESERSHRNRHPPQSVNRRRHSTAPFTVTRSGVRRLHRSPSSLARVGKDFLGGFTCTRGFDIMHPSCSLRHAAASGLSAFAQSARCAIESMTASRQRVRTIPAAVGATDASNCKPLLYSMSDDFTELAKTLPALVPSGLPTEHGRTQVIANW